MIRLVRIELRRNALPVLPVFLPIMVLVLWLSPISRHLTPVALWPERSTDLQSAIQGLGPFVAGAAAWTASREHRSDLTDLLRSTPGNPFRRAVLTWAATTGWAVLAYLATAVTIFAITAGQATWGGPVWWPVVVGLVALITCSAIGFAFGRRFPGRFTAPLVAIGTLLAMAAGMEAAAGGVRLGLLSPLFPALDLQSAVFYDVRPDLAETQLVFLAGVLAIALGALALGTRHEWLRVRRGGTSAVAAGFLLVSVAATLVTTGTTDHRGLTIPLLHNATSDQPVAYTPACSTDRLPVCVHPAYATELTTLSTVVNAIAAPLTGTPGFPVRAEHRAGETGPARVTGTPPVLTIPHFIIHDNALAPTAFAEQIETGIAVALLTRAPAHPTPAQSAVATYLLHQAGDQPAPDLPRTPATDAAAARLAAWAPATRTAWLTTHLPAIAIGGLTPEDIP